MDRSRLLVVCTANVCRSPLAAAVLAAVMVDDGTEVSSAGVRGLDAATMCAVAAARVPAAAAAEHRSRALTAELVESADLVLTMEREHRSATVRLSPGSQSKVFTLREAESLLEALRARGTVSAARLPELAKAMHAARGTVPPLVQPEVRRRWWQPKPEPADPLTIPDGHGLDLFRHEEAVEFVERTAEQVAEALVALRAARP